MRWPCPGGVQDFWVYSNAGREVRYYAGWNTTNSRPTGPTLVTRGDDSGRYVEVLTMSDNPTVLGGRPTGQESITNIESLSRSLFNNAGQAVEQRDYFNFNGLTYSDVQDIGTSGTHYLRTLQRYDKSGHGNRTEAPDGTITRIVHDAQGRVKSVWIGADDTPEVGWWSPENPAQMQLVARYEYDQGQAGDGNLTRRELFRFNNLVADQVSEYAYDWRNRLIRSQDGISWSGQSIAKSPAVSLTYDNLNRITQQNVYDAGGLLITGELTSDRLRSRVELDYDDWGRAYRQEVFGVDQNTVAISSVPQVTESKFDLRGAASWTKLANGLVQVQLVDGLGRPTQTVLTDGANDSTWADAFELSGDVVLAQSLAIYNDAGQLSGSVQIQREHGSTHLGSLVNGSAFYGRAEGVAYTYDLAGRVTDITQVGLLGLTPSTDWLTTSLAYDSAGNISSVTNPLGISSTSTYDLLGRTITELMGAGTAEAFSTSYDYDAGGRLLRITEPGSRSTEFGYDELGRATTVIERAGTLLERSSSTVLDRLGNVISATDPAGTQSTFSYNALGQLTSSTLAAGTPLERTTSQTYDVLGRVTSFTDARNYTTYWNFDDINQQVETVDALNNSWLASFDPMGQQTGLEAPNGATWTTQYDLLGRVTQNTNPLGKSTTYQYLVDGNRDTVIDALNRTTAMRYDDFGRVDKIIDPLERVTTFSYDNASRVVSQTDARGTISSTGYDALNRVTKLLEAVGQLEERSTSYAYNSAGDLVSIIDPRGIGTTFDHDSAGRVIEVTQAAGKPESLTTAYQYDVLDQVTLVTAPGNRQTAYAYDLMGQLTTLTEGVGTNLERDTSFQYDLIGNTTQVIDPLGRISQWTYDALNRMTKATEAFGTSLERSLETNYDTVGQVAWTKDALGNKTSYTYDKQGQLLSVADPLNRVTNYAYDAVGNVTSVTNPLNQTINYAYDAADQLIQVTDPLSRSTQFDYDAVGNRTKITDPRGNDWLTAFDRLNRPVSFTNPLNETSTIAYDANDNIVETINPRWAEQTATYDALNRQTSSTNAVGATTSWTYDSSTGDLIEITDPLNFSTTLAYDALGRVVSQTAPSGGVTSRSYDALDRVIKITEPMGQETHYSYDILSRMTQFVDANYGLTSFTYDLNDNRLSLTDPVGNKTVFGYDLANQLVSETDPLGKITTYEYDVAGQLLAIEDRLSRRREWSYDAAGQATEERWRDASNILLQTQTFGYDANGNLTTASDPDGSYTISYDKLNRASMVQQPFGMTLSFAYDAAGNRITVADSEGGVQTSSYDLANQLTSRTLITSDSEARVDFTYTLRGEVATQTRSADALGMDLVAITTNTYDGTGRLTQRVTEDDSNNTISSYAYAYDKSNRLTSETINGTTRSYSYDDLNQVVSDNGVSINYDDSGNRVGPGITIGTGNRLLNDGTWSYTYDDAGQVIGKASNSETWTYQYDHRGQLTQASELGGLEVNYSYDAFGNRLERSVDDGTTSSTERFAYDGWDTSKPNAIGSENFDVWADLDDTNTITTQRIFGAAFDEPLARLAGEDVAWYDVDKLGSVRKVFDNTGTVIGSRDFSGFGEIISEAGAGLDRYAFTAREWDADLGLQYSRARMYDPVTGRWMSEDPIGFAAGDSNLSRYVGNGATNATDPSGLDEIEIRDGNAYYHPTKPGWFAAVRQEANGGGWLLGGTRTTKGQLEIQMGGQWFNLKYMQQLAAKYNSGEHAAYLSEEQRAFLHNVFFVDANRGNGKPTDPWPFVIIRGIGDTLMGMLSSVPRQPNSTDAITHAHGDKDPTNPFNVLPGVSIEVAPAKPKDYDPNKRPDFKTDFRFMRFFEPGLGGSIIGNRYGSGQEDPLCEGFGPSQSTLAWLKQIPADATMSFYGPLSILMNPSQIPGMIRQLPRHIQEFIWLALNDPGYVSRSALVKVVDHPGTLALDIMLMALSGGYASIVVGGERITLQSLRTLQTQSIRRSLSSDLAVAEGRAAAGPVRAARIEFSQVNLGQACFSAGTPLLIPGGSKPVELFQVGDLILSRSEGNLDGPLEAKVVEELFVRLSKIVVVLIRGQEIRTTLEHPFWVLHKGWTPAWKLTPDDLLISADGQYVPVSGLRHTEDWETVYNLRVADFHTYFVGTEAWAFSVWAHNSGGTCAPKPVNVKAGHSYPPNVSRLGKNVVNPPTHPTSPNASIVADGQKVYRTMVAESSNSTHGFKHLKAQSASDAQKISSGGGAAQYLPEADLAGITPKGLEKLALEKGVIVEHGGGYHAYLEFDRPIGFNNGKPTSWIRAELSGGVYHGHPFDPTKLPAAVTGEQ